MSAQQTLKAAIKLRGIGVHSGEEAELRVLPADVNNGITFRRTDSAFLNRPVHAHLDNVVSSEYSTTLNEDGISVRTVEHLLASLFAMGVDNAVVEVNGPEIPILDGSALPIVEGIQRVGLLRQNTRRKYLKVLWSVVSKKGDKRITIVPAPYFKISYMIDFEHPCINRQIASFAIDPQVFATEIAPARTFGFLDQVEVLKKAGHIKGASPDNAIVLDQEDVLNGPLRFVDEFVRHKMLDAIGDFALLGIRILGHVIIEKGGHAMHLRGAKALLEKEDTWTYIDEAPDTGDDDFLRLMTA